jgi:hypothetical protein
MLLSFRKNARTRGVSKYLKAGFARNPKEGRIQETGDRRQETGDRRQETGDRRQETGDRRQETGDRRQETGDRRQDNIKSKIKENNRETFELFSF